VLDVLSTHPTHQHRGAGTILMEWGTAIADEMKVEAFIEGTIHAKHLYEKNGFVVTPNEYIKIPVPGKWRDRPLIQFFFFERPAKSV